MTPKTRVYLYFVTVGLFSLAMLLSGVMDLILPPAAVAGMRHLGYPDYFARILGAWKVLGTVVILLPRLSRLKEWAYAGFTFDLTGAAISHLSSGDGVGKASIPLALLAIGLVSWALRPGTRKLAMSAATTRAAA
jgi:uncharacterized membrane protein YphA (DoxX/SURF4 family)